MQMEAEKYQHIKSFYLQLSNLSQVELGPIKMQPKTLFFKNIFMTKSKTKIAMQSTRVNWDLHIWGRASIETKLNPTAPFP